MNESELSRYAEVLARETGSPREEIARLALAIGLRQLWRTHTLSRYRSHDLSREEAVEAVGIHWVEISDAYHKVLTEDLAWALDQDDAFDEDSEGDESR